MSSKNLRVQVFKEKECMVDLTLPIASLEFIESLMPQKVLDKLIERNFNLPQLLRDVRASGYAAQTLFEMSTTERSYKVWIV
jgi:hypothetical protein